MSANPTPLSPYPFEAFTLSLVLGTVAEASPAPYSNTKEIIVLNTSTADAIKFKVADVSGGAPFAAIGTDSVLLPAGASITLAVGPEGYRQPLATSAWWAVENGSGLNLVFEASTVTQPAQSVDVVVTYVQSPGGAGAVAP